MVSTALKHRNRDSRHPDRPIRRVAMSAKEYLDKFGVESAVAKAVTQILKERPTDPIAAIGQLLLNASAKAGGIGVGSTFPMDVIVHQGARAQPPFYFIRTTYAVFYSIHYYRLRGQHSMLEAMSTFLQRCEALVVSLPGAFTHLIHVPGAGPQGCRD